MLFDRSFVELPVNTQGRDLVVGDLHGQLGRLHLMLEWLAFDPARDRLICVGDLIDKGKGSKTLLRMLQAKPWFFSVIGNHEAMMAGAVRHHHGVERVWFRQDIAWTTSVSRAELNELAGIVDGVPLAIELPLPDGRRVGIVHAEVAIDSTWEAVRAAELYPEAVGEDGDDTVVGSLLWGRRRAFAGYRQRLNPKAKALPARTRARTWEALQPVPGIDWVLSGHSLVTRPATPMVVANCVMLETGAYRRGGWLTALEPSSGCYWQVGGRKQGRRGPFQLPGPGPIEAFRPTPKQQAKAELEERKIDEAMKLFL